MGSLHFFDVLTMAEKGNAHNGRKELNTLTVVSKQKQGKRTDDERSTSRSADSQRLTTVTKKSNKKSHKH